MVLSDSDQKKISEFLDLLTGVVKKQETIKLSLLAILFGQDTEIRKLFKKNKIKFGEFVGKHFKTKSLNEGTKIVSLKEEKQEVKETIAVKKKSEIKKNTNKDWTMVTSTGKCKKYCDQLINEEYISIDFEGVNLGFIEGSLCLVQICSRTCGVLLFDVQENPKFFENGLKSILESNSLTKIIHDCRNDCKALYKHGVTLNNIIDTQIAYSIKYNYIGDIGLAKLILLILGKQYSEKKNAPHLSNYKFWSERPIPDNGLIYAAKDVKYLLEVFDTLYGSIDINEIQNIAFRSDARLKQSIDSIIDVRDSTNKIKHNLSNIMKSINQDKRINYTPSIKCEFEVICNSLPNSIRTELLQKLPTASDDLTDIIMDLHRPVRLINSKGPTIYLGKVVVEEDIEYVLDNCGPITDSNRACVGNSLHRCSVIREGNIITGLTLRLARIFNGIAQTIIDVLNKNKSILIIGAPGTGKTTLLRDIGQLLASDVFDKRVMIVDTNNEIGGEQTLPHHAIGFARRMKVGNRINQHKVMLEAVQNHTPEVLVIDEIGTTAEANEAISVSQRGVQLIATTHGKTIIDVIQNPSVRNLIGGVNTVILSAAEKVNQNADRKTRLERKTPPAFDVCIELLENKTWRIHDKVAESVDLILRNSNDYISCEIRTFSDNHVTISRDYFPDKETQAIDLQLEGNDEGY